MYFSIKINLQYKNYTSFDFTISSNIDSYFLYCKMKQIIFFILQDSNVVGGQDFEYKRKDTIIKSNSYFKTH